MISLFPPPPPTIQMKVECRSSFQGTEVILLQFKVFCSKKKIFTSEPPPQEVPPSLSPVKDFTSALSRKRKYNKYVLQSLCAPLVIWIHFFFFSPPPPHRLQTWSLRAGFFCSTNWQYFAADGRLPYLLETLTYRLLFDSADSRLGIPACSSVIPGRFITLNLLKPYSQEDLSSKKKTQHAYTHTAARYLKLCCLYISFVYRSFFSLSRTRTATCDAK